MNTENIVPTNALSLSETPERIGSAIIEAIQTGAAVILLPSNPTSEQTPLIIFEGDIADDLPAFQKMLEELPQRQTAKTEQNTA
jgi:hypothetical protein